MGTERCGFCGRFITAEWRAQWNCFAHEAAAFCSRCGGYAPWDYGLRRAWGCQAGIMSAAKASDYVHGVLSP